MRLRFHEDPKEWRKAALLSLLGPSVILGLLRYRGRISTLTLSAAMFFFAAVALTAWVRPGWFRGYYRFATWLGFQITSFLGKAALAVIFFVVLTPFGMALRLFGYDPLQRRRGRERETFWEKPSQESTLDSMF